MLSTIRHTRGLIKALFRSLIKCAADDKSRMPKLELDISEEEWNALNKTTKKIFESLPETELTDDELVDAVSTTTHN